MHALSALEPLRVTATIATTVQANAKQDIMKVLGKTWVSDKRTTPNTKSYSYFSTTLSHFYNKSTDYVWGQFNFNQIVHHFTRDLKMADIWKVVDSKQTQWPIPSKPPTSCTRCSCTCPPRSWSAGPIHAWASGWARRDRAAPLRIRTDWNRTQRWPIFI